MILSGPSGALSEMYWRDIRREYSGGELIYEGYNTAPSAATDIATWLIKKHTWSGGECVRSQGPIVGSWDGRGSLGW